MKDPLQKEELEDLALRANVHLRDLVNPRSTIFRKMKVNRETMTDEQAANLILENPRVMRRPLFATEDRVVVGYKPEAVEGLF